MIGKTLASLALIGMTVPLFGQSSKEPLVLKPTSAWQVDYANERCRLARQFGAGDTAVYALFDRYGPEESFRLTLAGMPLRTSLNQGDATVRFGPDENEQQLNFLKGEIGFDTNAEELPALIFSSGGRLAPPSDAEQLAIKNRDKDDEWIKLAPISEARQKAIKYMTIGKPLRRAVVLETGAMRGALAAMDKCIDNLMTTWGIDVEKHKTLTREAKPKQSPGKWVVSSDYPMDMWQEGQPALVDFRLNVGIDGTPTACHIQSTTRPKEFDDAVCGSVMRRARFDPALDAEGRPIASYYRNRVVFTIPR